MKNTETYKLNLIEKDDVFSPDPLNENMEKVEKAITAEAAAEASARAEAVADLDQRLKVFEVRRFAYGTYIPESGGLDVSLGFCPFIVLIQAFGTFLSGTFTQDVESSNGAITSDGFHINSATSSGTITKAGQVYSFVAFG